MCAAQRSPVASGVAALIITLLCLVACAPAAAAAGPRAPRVPASRAASPRTRSKFDLGWKFHLGHPAKAPSSCNASVFPVNLNHVQCLDLHEQIGASSAEECRGAACSNGASIWQWGGGCWIGLPPFNCTHGPSPGGIVGGGRMNAPPPGENSCIEGMPCEPSYDDSSWAERTVPHDFVIEGTVDPNLNPNHGALATNVSWYRRKFTLPESAADQLVWLSFDGVYRNADVYVNGALVKHHTEAYTSFHAYLHNASAGLKFGPGESNVVAVFVDATQSELWAYEGGGIYRHVWLETADKLSVVPWGFAFTTYVNGTVTGNDATRPQTADSALALPQLDLQNAGTSEQNVTVCFALADGDGKQVLTASFPVTVPAGGWKRLAPGGGPFLGEPLGFGSTAEPVRLWNTADSPPLYTATASVLSADGGKVLDSVSTTIGVRDALFDARHGLLLNGAKVLVKGTSNHLGFGGVGLAAPDRIMEFQVATLKAMGANAFRTAHNPVAPELLEYADRYGMLVWEENRFLTPGVVPMGEPEVDGVSGSGAVELREPQLLRDEPSRFGGSFPNGVPPGEPALPPSYNGETTGTTAEPVLLQDAQDMVLRDRNHPSIILWSLCNELGCLTNDPNGGDIIVQFKQAIQAVDTSRPITGNTVQAHFFHNKMCDCTNPSQSAECANCQKFGDNAAAAMDVQSFSYEYEVYERYHRQTPWKPVGGGESCSCTTDRGEFDPDPEAHSGHTGPSDAQLGGLFECIEASWASVARTEYVFGNFAWTGFDYRGETGPTGWPAISSHYGIFDIAGFPKVGTGYYKAWWRDLLKGPGHFGVSLSPDDWTAPTAVGKPIEVRVTTAAHAAELYLNGELQPGGRKQMPLYSSLAWTVPFAKGNLTAVAFDAGGAVLATQTVLSAGKRSSLRASVANPYLHGRNASEIAADGQDVALITVELLDAAGILVPDADINVSFSIHGPGVVLGTTNGDPACHVPATSPRCPTFHGLLRGIVRSSALAVRGVITVHVEGEGLGSTQVSLRAV